MQRPGFKSALGYLMEAFLFKIKASKDGSFCLQDESLTEDAADFLLCYLLT